MTIRMSLVIARDEHHDTSLHSAKNSTAYAAKEERLVYALSFPAQYSNSDASELAQQPYAP